MSAANEILAAFKTIVEAAFAGKTLHTRRGSELNPIYAADMDVEKGCFSASINAQREHKMAYAGKQFVKYPVELAYLTVELPAQREPSEEIEDVLSAAAKLFLVPRLTSGPLTGKPGLQGVTEFNGSEVCMLAPYTLPFGAKTINVSRVLVTIETLEDA